MGRHPAEGGLQEVGANARSCVLPGRATEGAGTQKSGVLPIARYASMGARVFFSVGGGSAVLAAFGTFGVAASGSMGIGARIS